MHNSMDFSWLPLAALTPSARNPRTHTKAQIRKIARSIEEFGFLNPILIDGGGNIIAGHARLEAARLLSHDRVPVLRVEHLSEQQIRAYRLADNRLAELAGWDHGLLAIEFSELIEADYRVELTGFDTPEIDLIIGDRHEPDEEPDVPLPSPGATVSRPGDLWLLGSHRLLCGNALEQASYEMLLGNERAQMVFTDPPFNVPVDGHVSGLGQVRHREFAMAAGEMTREEFTTFLRTVIRLIADHSTPGAIVDVAMDWRHMREVLEAADTILEMLNLCIWAKTNGGMGSFYRSQHELVFVFRNGAAPHINNIQLGRYGRNRTNVWQYAGVNTFRRGRMEDLTSHPTVKPVGLVADAILDCSHRNGIILDPFAGSGTTLLAAERTGRRARVMELDPAYSDLIVRRWQTMTGKAAVHAVDGSRFDDRAAASPEALAGILVHEDADPDIAAAISSTPLATSN